MKLVKKLRLSVSYTDDYSHYEVVTSGSSDPVENINEAPVIESSSLERLQIGSSLDTVIYDAEASDPDGDTLTYSLSGDDASYVTIDPDDGEVRLISEGDFKALYNFDITVSDGILTDTQSVTLTYSLDPTSVYQVEYSGSVLEAAEANEVDPFSQLLSSETMPTDAELRGVAPVQDEAYEQNFFSGYNAAFFIDLVDSIESSGGIAKLYDEAITVSDSSDGTDFYIVSDTSDQVAGSLGSDIFVLGFGTGINPTDSYFTNSVLVTMI